MANPNTNENMTVHFKVKDPRGPHCIVIVAELRPVSTRIGGALQFSHSDQRPLGITILGS
jgi:hypothetical protein